MKMFNHLVALLLGLSLLFSQPAFVYCAVDEDVGRNEYVTSEAMGTNGTAHQPHVDSEDNKEPEINDAQPPEILTETEISDADNYRDRSSFVDSVIYFTGVFMWIFGTLWVTLAVLDKVAPFLAGPVIKALSFGKVEHWELNIGQILGRFIVVAAIGTVFVQGWVKVWLGTFFGYILSRL